MIYLETNEYATYGVPGTITTDVIETASQIVDSVLGRPDGLLIDHTTGSTMLKTGAPITEMFDAPLRGAIKIATPRVPLVTVTAIQYWDGQAWQPVQQFYFDTTGSAFITTYIGCVSDLRISYVAGWISAAGAYPSSVIPTSVKAAVARIANRMNDVKGIFGTTSTPPVDSVDIGEIKVQKRASKNGGVETDTMVDADTLRMLAPFTRRF